MHRLFTLFLAGLPLLLMSQETMRVERCTAIDPDSPVYNVYIDDADEKWVSNSQGLFQVHAADLATKIIMAPDEISVLQLPGGNADIRIPKDAINSALDGALSETNTISAAYYNEVQDHLWIGTTESGVYLFRTQPQLREIKEIQRRMPKLRSNKINSIYVDGDEDLHFICTDEGVVVGKGGRWGLEERYFSFQAIAHRGKEVWLLAEDLIWIVDGDKQWRSLSIDLEEVQGQIKDIALDKNGKLWIASEYLTVFDIENERYKIFDGADYFTSNDVNTLSADRTGAIWVGTQDKGLYLIEEESAMTVTVLLDNPLSCDPQVNDASLIVKINGGQPPYSYQWGSDALSGNEVANLGPGLYQLTVTDSKGIAKSTTGEVPDTRLKLAVSQDQSVGPDGEARGSASAEVEGGKPRYIYQWDNGEMGPRAERLTAGMHHVTVTDANGCQAQASIEVGREIGDLMVNLEKTSESNCADDQSNGVAATVSGGLGPYTYNWSDGTVQGSSASGLAAGTYRVTVTDSQGATAEASVNFTEVSPMEIEVTANSQADLDGKNGAAIVRVSGGNGRMTYTWDNGENKARATELNAGMHTVTVTDANGCTVEGQVEITQEIGVLAVRIEKRNESKCAEDGLNEIIASASGGVEPYNFKWSDPNLEGLEHKGLSSGTYFVTVTDAEGNTAEQSVLLNEPAPLEVETVVVAPASPNGNNGRASVSVKGGTGEYQIGWDNGENKERATKLEIGRHTVTVTDANGCVAYGEVEIEQEVGELAVRIEKVDESICADDGRNEIIASISGGVEPYSIVWSDPNLEGLEHKGLKAGTYFLTITDGEGSKTEQSVLIREPSPIQVVTQVNAPASTGNSDGRASLHVEGGTGNYQYTWDNGETEIEAKSLSPGEHSVTVTDDAGCKATATVEITEDILELALNLNKTDDNNCYGEQNGVIVAEVRGGKGPYTYTWNDASLNGERISQLAGGNYSLTVTDAVGNEANASVTIANPVALEAQIVEQRGVTDETTDDGRAEVEVSGGTAPYSFAWDDQSTEQKAENLTYGNHHVTVTDANGCTVQLDFETEKKILPQLSLSKLREGEVVQMQMLQFDADSTNLNEGAKPILDEVYYFLKDNPGVVIRVEGHTNNIPPDEFCDKLSTARAKSVAEYIVQQGVADQRVYYRGYGKRQPLYSNRTAEGRRKNQRVEIKILTINEDG